ncbi:hypothetical protein, conserved [Trypanosoma brucei brucei TREU927]|uniref:Protein MCM10 homolog n=1 Tax=Trypanosoma brucei brucei (strain 927/4 GUTat10.1) TaxID=185431 RepID=Q38FX6_TRYB2|nr:hypothetical protein, conserved [Trypanosoma brucei brucei TREU927]EAN76294.1 hypothetical protein, conserved [Trypanosoma brucei brucei TREU927]
MARSEGKRSPSDSDDRSDEDLFAVFHDPSGNVSGSVDSTIGVAPNSQASRLSQVTAAMEDPVVSRLALHDLGTSVFPANKTFSGAEGSTNPSASFMSVVTATPTAKGGVDDAPIRKPQLGIVREPNSNIKVSRPTRSCEQLAVILAQHPFTTFEGLRRSVKSAGGNSLPPSTVVGVVVHKTEPKRASTGRGYGVVYLWDMKGPFVSPAGEVAILLGGSAFDTHYTRILSGLVLAVSGMQRMENQSVGKTTFNATTSGGSTASGDCGILKVTTCDQVRVLGFASDLATCQGTQQRSGELCKNIVNKSLSNYCAHHMANLQREARGAAPGVSGKFRSQPLGTARLSAPALTCINLATLQSAQITASKTSSQALRRQKLGFLTVRGSTGLPASTPASADVMAAGNAYAGVVAGDVLPVNDVAQNAKRLLSNGDGKGMTSSYIPTQIGVGTQGRAVLGAAAAAEEAKNFDRLLRLALHPSQRGTKRPREGCEQPPWVEVREKFAPLSAPHDRSAFAPLRGGRRGDAILTGRNSYNSGVTTQGGKGTRSAIVNVVERQLRAEGSLAKFAGRSSVGQEEVRLRETTANKTGGSAPPPASLLGKVAESLHSVNDELRALDERQRLERQAERLLQQDKALEALADVTEQKLKAHYCRQCDRWYLRRNERCKSLGHIVETRETVRRFIQCEHCRYKTSVIGDVRPSKLIPRCPRCSADVQWRASNAAPENALVISLREDA